MQQAKKFVLTTMTATFLGLAGLAAADDGRGRYIAAYDTNGDGVVSSDEIIAVRTADFNTYDVNADGSLSLAEYQSLETAEQARRLTSAFSSLDTDSSSTLTLAEFTVNASTGNSSLQSNVFALTDANGDGYLTQAEFAVLYDHSDHSGIFGFARLDTDYSQSLLLAEFTALPTRGSGHGGGKGKGKGRGNH